MALCVRSAATSVRTWCRIGRPMPHRADASMAANLPKHNYKLYLAKYNLTVMSPKPVGNLSEAASNTIGVTVRARSERSKFCLRQHAHGNCKVVRPSQNGGGN